ncbi:hypothetical protein M9Y10_025519 [Tritrichomonas musculus]|uniref:Uncharacterized protein n=1 Tax=Tritrichomonas musculus TaxID=1915356 RepID=A0ABR2H8Y0_9EUKA
MLNSFSCFPNYQNPFLSPNIPLKKVTITNETSLSDLLKDTSIVQIYRTNCILLNNFFIAHVEELMMAAFKDDDSVTTTSAYRILSIPYYYLISALITKAHFGNYATNLLNQTNISDRLINRICTITRSIFCCCDINSCKVCNYLAVIFNYSYSSSVFDLFATVFSIKDEIESIQNWMIDNGIIEFIEHKIKLLLNTSKIEGFSKEFEALINLFRLLSIIFKNIPKSTEKSKLYTLFDKLPTNLPNLLYNFIWETLNAVFSKNNFLKLIKFTNEARDILISPTKHIYRYHSESVSFLTKYVNFRSDLIDTELIKSILGLFLQFSHCSFFMTEAQRFFIEASRVDVLLCRIVKYVVPVLIVEATMTDHNLVPYFSFSILENLMKISSAKEIILNLDNGKEFIEEILPAYIKKRDSGYGGISNSNSLWSILSSPLSIF